MRSSTITSGAAAARCGAAAAGSNWQPRPLRRRGIGVAAAVEVFHLLTRFAVGPVDPDEVIRPDRRFAMATWNIEHVAGLAQAGEPAAQRTHQRLALLDAGAPMGGAGREVAVVEIIRFDPALDQGAHQLAEHGGIIVDAAQ